MSLNDSTAKTFAIPEDAIGQRLDRYLTSVLPHLSRSGVQQLITDGAVIVNGKVGKSGYALRANDTLVLLRGTVAPPASIIEPRDLPLDVVYEDDDLLVVNKAAGMVVHPAPGHYTDTLVNALLARYPEMQAMTVATGDEADEDEISEDSNDTVLMRPGIVHRLDKDTSGLLLVAKNARTRSALLQQMQRHEVTKRYLALVYGLVTLDHGTIDAPIGRDARHRQQMAITVVSSREARTHFRVLERFNHHTLLLVQLETGRTHQIRVHLQAIGHPVMGDPVYGPKKSNQPIQRQFLHASHLHFIHPTTGQELHVDAPLPPDMQKILDQKTVL